MKSFPPVDNVKIVDQFTIEELNVENKIKDQIHTIKDEIFLKTSCAVIRIGNIGEIAADGSFVYTGSKPEKNAGVELQLCSECGEGNIIMPLESNGKIPQVGTVINIIRKKN